MKGVMFVMENNKRIKDEIVKDLIRRNLDTDPDYELMDVRYDSVFKMLIPNSE